jgi:hypothetical protein
VARDRAVHRTCSTCFTSLSCPQSAQRRGKMPWARVPHSKQASKASAGIQPESDFDRRPVRRGQFAAGNCRCGQRCCYFAAAFTIAGGCANGLIPSASWISAGA